MRRLPAVARLWGVGRVTAADLESMGIRMIGQLAAVPLDHLRARVGANARQLLDLAHGIDKRSVEPVAAAKSMGAEETFERIRRSGSPGSSAKGAWPAAR